MAKVRSRGTGQFTHMVAFDIWQKEGDGDFAYIEGPRAVADMGIGRYNFQLMPDLDNDSAANVEVYITLESLDKVRAEMLNMPATFAESTIAWHKVGDYTTDGDLLEFLPPVSYIAFVFTGATSVNSKACLVTTS